MDAETSEPGASLQKILSNISHKSPSIRRKAIAGAGNWIKESDSNLNDSFRNEICAEVTNLILDHSESVREMALQFLIKLRVSNIFLQKISRLKLYNKGTLKCAAKLSM